MRARRGRPVLLSPPRVPPSRSVGLVTTLTPPELCHDSEPPALSRHGSAAPTAPAAKPGRETSLLGRHQSSLSAAGLHAAQPPSRGFEGLR